MSTRSQSSGKLVKETESSISTLKSSQKIILLPDKLKKCPDVEIIQLRHPATNSSSLFLFGKSEDEESHLAELKTFDEGHRSWFIEETVQSDGKLYLATIFNPIYIVLPYLIKAEKLVPLDQLLEDEEFPFTHQLSTLLSKSLPHVADSKGQADLNVWKYNEEKTLSWLEKRVDQLKQRLMDDKVCTSTAQALTFVRTMDQEGTKEAYLELAHGILSEYLPQDVSLKLRARVGLPEQKVKKPLKSQEPPAKKAKTEPGEAVVGPADDYSSKAVPVKKEAAAMSTKAKALAKSAKGNKSIMSFFGKKS